MARWYMPEDEEERTHHETEPNRPEYEMEAPEKKLNPVTNKLEPHFSKKATLKRYAASVVTIGVFIFAAIGTVSGLMIYKTTGPYVWVEQFNVRTLNLDYITLTGATGAILNGIIIGILSKVSITRGISRYRALCERYARVYRDIRLCMQYIASVRGIYEGIRPYTRYIAGMRSMYSEYV